METKFAETTVTFQSNQPITPIEMTEENKAVLRGIATHLIVLKIKLKTIKKTKKTAIPNVMRSCEMKSIVSTVIIEAPPKKSSPKKAYSFKTDLISSTSALSFFDISSPLATAIDTLIPEKLPGP